MTAEQDDRLDGEADATELLRAERADVIRHPGGTLMEHLHRVHALLDSWGARRALRLAGLCHAFYGTDGFPVALGSIHRREELSVVIGTEAEDLVYLYASCDRARTYPSLHRPDGAVADRFTGLSSPASPGQRRDLAELTVANELDVVRTAALERSQITGLLDLFVTWRSLLSDPAFHAVEDARRSMHLA
ncbi:DUF6817 domain-containing protein [Actinomadura mexicana]|uniref:DUF6817 domain-containing protein n=1 Tax=Actinomadura mexicana TaxID=134959 RepID=A0A239CAF2_9ACTN|nr:hypothetical protein [Actinomadura mexicana]SNS17187.1 hypothetical protein SAMN06265355_11298 [Actinomadura mexicana]